MDDEQQDLGLTFQEVERRLRRVLKAEPTGLAAAISEVRSCEQFPEYLWGVQNACAGFTTLDSAVFAWAMRRAEIWMGSSD